jgi:di/tricarboxylate transporter
MVLLASTGVLPIATLALTAVAAMVVTGCLPLRLAYGSIDSTIVVLIAGMLALGMALERTGVAALVAHSVVTALSDHGPLAVLGGIYFLAMLVTSVISNNAVGILFTPIAINAARDLGYQPAPFVFAVLFGASAAFATPISYQTNLFVYGPGNYRFTDYIRVGAPLNVLLFITALWVIPLFWPLVPLA